jgi:hypothetical protein
MFLSKSGSARYSTLLCNCYNMRLSLLGLMRAGGTSPSAEEKRPAVATVSVAASGRTRKRVRKADGRDE